MNPDMSVFFQNEASHTEGGLKQYLSALIAETHRVAAYYSSRQWELARAAEDATVTVTYSSTGEGAFRGVYTPSLVCPYAVTGYRKGRMLKTKPASGTYFSYALDGDGRLLQADHYAKGRLQTTEYLVRTNPAAEYGLVFGQGMLLIGNRTVYDDKGRIAEYFESRMPLMKGQNLFEYEKYYYDDSVRGSLEGADKVWNGIYPSCFRYCRYALIGKGEKTTLLTVSDQVISFENG
jgi:hypothetical protein